MLSGGSLDVTSSSDAALTIAQDLAKKLGAEIIGEEGENPTDAQFSRGLVTAP